MTTPFLFKLIAAYAKRFLIFALVVFLNVFICFSVSGMVLLQLLSYNIEKHCCLILAILTAITVQLYIVYYHKLKNYINNGAGSNE